VARNQVKVMGELHLKMSRSLDGFVGGPKGEIDWIFPTTDAEATDWILVTISGASAHLMGRHTFHNMAAAWPSSTGPFADPMNRIPKVVFSKGEVTSADATGNWANPTIARGDLAAEIARLKQESPSYLIAHGGASFAQSLCAADLIDEYQLLIHPVALGRGLSLFGALAAPRRLKHKATLSFPAGAVAVTYRRWQDQ
jgi:dihydrofolate reductase